jgi:GT2 family glycosyltransferase
MSLTIIIPSKNSVNLEACVAAIRRQGETGRILVVDDGLDTRPEGCEYIPGEKPFVFARNCNLGIRASGTDDVLLVNDDTLLATPNGYTRLQRVAEEHPDYGVISASMNHAGNLRQMRRTAFSTFTEEPEHLCFVCVLIPRRTLDLIGLLDERFNAGYGWEDVDFSRRCRQAGLKLGIEPAVFVDHYQLTPSFRGNPKLPEWLRANEKIYLEKWGNHE